MVTSATRQHTMSLIRGKLTPTYAALAWSYAALRQRPRSYASTPSHLETHAEDLPGNVRKMQPGVSAFKLITHLILIHTKTVILRQKENV